MIRADLSGYREGIEGVATRPFKNRNIYSLLIAMGMEKDDPLIGKPAPAFCLPDADNTRICLEQFRQKWVVLYFYPRDNTPGCTIEAMQFNASLEQFASLGAQVIGVSKDPPASHRAFAEKHNLSVLLLSDVDHTVLEAYGAWKPVNIFGKEVLGTGRDTVLIDPAGMIVAVWRKVNPKGHAAEVREVLMDRMKGGA